MKKISVILLLLILILTGCGREVINNNSDSDQEADYNYVTDDTGRVIPDYTDVNKSEYDKDCFSCDEFGRMIYTKDSFCSKTGIDVSNSQGDIDWEKVALDGIDFVMLRVGFRGWGPSGLIYEDDRFEDNYKQAIANGLSVGVYFYSQAINEKEAAEEADFVLKHIKGKHITYPVAFDWEPIFEFGSVIKNPDARTYNMDRASISACADKFSDVISEAGYNCLIYFNYSDGYSLFNLNDLSDNHFWLAQYNVTPDFYYDFKIWQYSDHGKVDGINGDVDMDICLYDY